MRRTPFLIARAASVRETFSLTRTFCGKVESKTSTNMPSLRGMHCCPTSLFELGCPCSGSVSKHSASLISAIEEPQHAIRQSRQERHPGFTPLLGLHDLRQQQVAALGAGRRRQPAVLSP